MDHEDARQRQRQRRRRRGLGGRRGCEIEEEERAAPITGDPGSLERLCTVTVRACQLMRPLISAIYDELGQPSTSSDLGGGLLPSDEGGASSSSAAAAVVVVQKAKEDGSAFTIADGLVQRLLVDELFSRVPFRDVVGEEEEDEGAGGGGDGDSRGGAAVDARDGDERSWSRVNGLTVPMHLRSMVESTRSSVGSLAEESLLARGGGGASSSSGSDDDDDDRRCRYYRDLTVFIDPIDGTKEFSTGTMGGQCSVCVGFANGMGRAVGGVVYRPLSQPSPSPSDGGGGPDGGAPSGPTWAAGALSEGYAACDFGRSVGRTPDDDDDVGSATAVAEIALAGRGGVGGKKGGEGGGSAS